MDKVLLLSCNTGQGHNSCAQAVKEYFEGRDIQCEILDSLDFISEGFGRFMSWGHSFMYRYIPGLFRWGYGYSKAHPWVFKYNSGIYKILTIGVERLHSYLTDGGFDTVICTHVFSAMMLTHLQKRHHLSVKTAFVGTDYTFYPGMKACDLQKYFIAGESLTNAYRNLGIPRKKIIVSGIPIQQKFWKQTDKGEAKQMLGIGRKNQHLLMMCGSMGCGPIAKMLKQIAGRLPQDVEVTVICVTNKRLYRKLSARYKECPRIHITGYTDKMPLYMDSADLCLTKPGGISVTEAAVKNVPMAFINAVAGCEQYNMDFFVGMGAAFTADSPAALVKKSIAVLKDRQKRKEMEEALQEYRQADGAECIFYEMSKGAHICKDPKL